MRRHRTNNHTSTFTNNFTNTFNNNFANTIADYSSPHSDEPARRKSVGIGLEQYGGA